MKIYYPSVFGDINIEQDNKNVVLSTVDLTVSEEEVLKEIIKKFVGKIKEPIKTYENTKVIIENVKIEDIHKFMIKKLKKNKLTLTAIKLKDGKLELVDEIKKEHVEKADSAVTTQKPTRGCPLPSITVQKEVRASTVLKEFLTQQQIEDFNKHRSFVSIGNYTHHPYLITSRWSLTIEKFGQVYDLVEKRKVCTSCKEIPPSEEMLAMKLSVELNELDFLNTPMSE
jgi:hypothetical protein